MWLGTVNAGAISVPTGLTVRAAEAIGVTLIGLLRGDHYGASSSAFERVRQNLIGAAA
jgi:formate dehydrogenase assembly factor FdhD